MEPEDVIKCVALLATLAAGLGALASALATWHTARETRAAVRMQVFFRFSERDAAPEMGRATKILWEFAREGTGIDSIADRFRQLEHEKKVRWNEVDDARRVVHKFYLHLMQARQAGLFTDRELIIGTYKHQLNTVLKVLRPLEAVKQGTDYTRPVFRAYQELFDNYDDLYQLEFGHRPA